VHAYSLQQVYIFDEWEMKQPVEEHKQTDMGTFFLLLPYMNEFRGRILGTKPPLMFRPQLRHTWEESTQTHTYKQVRAEAFVPGDDSLVYFQLVVGTQQWGLIQNQSSFLKRVVEWTPQPCPFDTKCTQAQRP